MSVDVRIAPKVSTATVAGVEVRLSTLSLGGVPRGVAVLVAGPDGLSTVQAVDTMNSLAQHGYESVTAEPGRSGDDDFARDLVRLMVHRVADRGWTRDQTGVIGYGQGARAALVAASEETYGAAISVPRDARDVAGPAGIRALRTPWLCLTGSGQQDGVAGELAAYGDEVRAASTAHTAVISYPGVEHCLDDSVEPLVHQAAFDSWQRTAEWLNTHVAPRPTPLVQAWENRRRSDRPTSH